MISPRNFFVRGLLGVSKKHVRIADINDLASLP
jgi:hypothetical protein